jgi:hypothetical protein
MLSRGLDEVGILQARLSGDDGLQLRQLLDRYRLAKVELCAIVTEVDSASDCRECQGQCCLNGKYRLTVLDAAAAVSAGVPLTADYSQKPLCPYGSITGCRMVAGDRPADCVMFICETIDRKLSSEARTAFALQERIIRECIRDATILTGEKMGTPLLLWAAGKDADSN